MKIISFNVNGIRAIYNKGDLEQMIDKYDPDIICLQETKAQLEQIELLDFNNYNLFNKSAVKKGYSGVLILAKENYNELVSFDSDVEGRMIGIKIDDFYLLNCYFPNSQKEGKRLEYKLDFNEQILDFVEKNQKVIVCGDFNVAHEEIDLANPKANVKNPGFLPEEREFFSRFLDAGNIDIYRYFNPETIKYSWWSYRTKARERNIGWRIDYFTCTSNLIERVENIEILNDIYGSDHCPVLLELK